MVSIIIMGYFKLRSSVVPDRDDSATNTTKTDYKNIATTTLNIISLIQNPSFNICFNDPFKNQAVNKHDWQIAIY